MQIAYFVSIEMTLDIRLFPAERDKLEMGRASYDLDHLMNLEKLWGCV